MVEIIETPDTNCWLWQGGVTERGYGRVSIGGRLYVAHRVFYENAIGPVPDGLTLDHLCRVPACVNPGHVEPVTMRENTLRGIGPTAQNAQKTHCVRGHPLSGDNLRMESGRRRCLACKRVANAARYSAANSDAGGA